jgi:hypothetical protein
MTPSAAQLIDALRPLEVCFSAEEVTKLRAALSLAPVLERRSQVELQTTFEHATRSLPLIAQAIETSPSLRDRQQVAGRARDPETLVDRLCHTDSLCIEFSMPTGALFGRALVLAKVNLLKALKYSLEGAGADAEPTIDALTELIGEAVFSKLADELLTALASNPRNDMAMRRQAARKLVSMWDDVVQLPVGKLPSVLLSAWRARGKVRAIYGTLIGVSEMFSLVQAQCQSQFVNYFVRDHVTADEREAFREFLFAISYEDLQRLQEYMEENNKKAISPEEVEQVVGSPLHPLLPGTPNPEHMYNSYCRRRLRADYRVLSENQGPRKTAEGYMMESILKAEIEAGEKNGNGAPPAE